MKSADAVVSLIELARGERPYSLQNHETEDVLNMTLALLSELAVAFERIDRLERVVADRTGIALAELRDLDFSDGEAGQERDDAMSALVARVLRIRLDPRARAQQKD